MKVLLSVYACGPARGSEPGVGWNWVKQVARFHEVWVLTRANNREQIEKALARKPLPNVRWIYFDLPRWMRFWKKGQRGIHLYYYLWQIGAYFVGWRIYRQIGFDLVHHVTFVNYWMPSFLSLLPVPFIWGPVGGGESAPKAFWQLFSWRGKVYEILRDIARILAHLDPFVRLTGREIAFALATTEETARRLQALGRRQVEIHSNVGLPEEEIQRLASVPPRQSTPFRLVSIGRLLHLKGFNLGLKAFARFWQDFPESEYWIIGDGPERKRLERLARQLGVAEKVCFFGAVPRARVLELLADCDVLLHPSLHDSGGWVCLEAMAAGHPVICLDLGGPALQITDETGIKVPAISPEQVVNDLAKAILRLAQDPDLRARMGEAARKRVVEQFDWDKKGELMQRLYEEVILKG